MGKLKQRRQRRGRPLVPEFAIIRRAAYAAAAGLLVLWIVWYALTYSTRRELRRVQRELEAHPKLQDVSVSIPLLSRSMPASVPLKGLWIPGGFSYEVQVEVKGQYDPAQRVAHITGRKQVLMPYRKVVVDEKIAVTAGP